MLPKWTKREYYEGQGQKIDYRGTNGFLIAGCDPGFKKKQAPEVRRLFQKGDKSFRTGRQSPPWEGRLCLDN